VDVIGACSANPVDPGGQHLTRSAVHQPHGTVSADDESQGPAEPGRTAALQGAWTAPGPASGDDAGPGAGRAAGEKVPLRPLSERAGRRRTPGPTGARRRWRR